ncbi:SDR family NAD(P)-dependent oxidoreductase [Chthonobacter rhizosphaerae]|uniref:SDR family NAD(P)-dependent oxidoreductase n=1 Tax=Chthonobacter rhizosphaerae TaxID=2735553 RepID=UPI0015EF4705|nr:SDR family oxidoreductase [Chthonobacter rhizosphaerae]
MDFKDLSVVVTGAGGGIGAALVEGFGRAGARVIGCDRDGRSLDPLPLAGRATFDLADPASIRAGAADLLAAHGAPDVVVMNAGWTRGESFASMDEDAVGREIDVNLTGVARLTHALLGPMRARRAGAFVFVSSVNALAHYGNPAYSAAKAGILGLMRAVATEGGRDGVRANAVCPGSVRTPAWDHRIARDPAIPAALARLYPLGRIVTPAEVAEAVMFLASARASGITGQTLAVDAGLTAGNVPFIRDILGE